MKTGTPFNDVLATIKATHESKRDYSVDTRHLTFQTDAQGSLLSLEGMPESEALSTFAVTPHSHGQIRERLGIPHEYYKRLQSERKLHELLDMNVNELFRRAPERRLVRTLDGKVRAFLSDRYQVVDNWDIMMTVLPEMKELADRHGCVVESCEITEHRLYLKLKLTGIAYNLGKVTEGPYTGLDDVLHPMIYIQNSETGNGSVKIHPGIFRLVCKNGLMIDEASLTQYHVGRSVSATRRGYEESSYNVERLFSDETKEAHDKAFLLKIRDVMRAAVNSIKFEALVQTFGESRSLAIPAPKTAVEVIGKKYGLTDGEGEQILEALIAGNDFTMFGLVNAVTRHAQDARDYDRATELEAVGGKLLKSAGAVHTELTRLHR